MTEPRTELHWRVDALEKSSAQRDRIINRIAEQQSDMGDKLDRVLEKLTAAENMALSADGKASSVAAVMAEAELRKKFQSEEAAANKAKWQERRNTALTAISVLGLIYAYFTGKASDAIEQVKAFIVGIPK